MHGIVTLPVRLRHLFLVTPSFPLLSSRTWLAARPAQWAMLSAIYLHAYTGYVWRCRETLPRALAPPPSAANERQASFPGEPAVNCWTSAARVLGHTCALTTAMRHWARQVGARPLTGSGQGTRVVHAQMASLTFLCDWGCMLSCKLPPPSFVSPARRSCNAHLT